MDLPSVSMMILAVFSYVVERTDISDSMRWRRSPHSSVPRDGVFNSASCNDVLLTSFLVE